MGLELYQMVVYWYKCKITILWRDERDLSEDRVRIDLIDVFISAAVLVVAAKLDEAEGLLARQEGHDHGHDRANRRADVG